MFSDFQKQLKKHFDKLAKGELFAVEVDREAIWQIYLDSFPADKRQENDCRCCRQFIRQFGNIVAINNSYEIVSIWDNLNVKDEYKGAVQSLRDYVHSLLVTDIFLNPFASCGTKQNLDSKRGIVWNHFHLDLPREFVNSAADSKKSEARAEKDVLKRGLQELKIDATETVLELIEQNTLYRGTEFKGLLDSFLKLQKEFKNISEFWQDNFCWIKSRTAGAALSRIRNSAIGTLLINLSEGMEIETALRKYESVVAPTNYKRPVAAVTPKMYAAAKATLETEGLLGSLERRFATERDLNVNNVIFTHRPVKVTDIFSQLAQESIVNPKTVKAENIPIADFISNIVPQATTIEVLLENSHFPNFVSLITAVDESAPTLFKWPNPFSISYTGGVADSMKDLVQKAGGKVDGVLRFSIQWNDDGKNNIDFDAHAVETDGDEIAFNTYKKPSFSRDGGQLDVDIIQPNGKVAVENITWANKARMKHGMRKFFVHNYSSQTSSGGFSAEIEFDGEIYSFEYGKNLRGKEKINVAEVTLDKTGKFELKSLLDSKNSFNSKEKWGLKTGTYHKVTKMLLSPNFWETAVGNKHYMFMLENCTPDEKLRPFFNEFLKPELDKHRKALETVAAKIEVAGFPSSSLSGIGFSSTQQNNLIVRVNGAGFNSRIMKISF